MKKHLVFFLVLLLAFSGCARKKPEKRPRKITIEESSGISEIELSAKFPELVKGSGGTLRILLKTPVELKDAKLEILGLYPEIRNSCGAVISLGDIFGSKEVYCNLEAREKATKEVKLVLTAKLSEALEINLLNPSKTSARYLDIEVEPSGNIIENLRFFLRIGSRNMHFSEKCNCVIEKLELCFPVGVKVKGLESEKEERSEKVCYVLRNLRPGTLIFEASVPGVEEGTELKAEIKATGWIEKEKSFEVEVS